MRTAGSRIVLLPLAEARKLIPRLQEQPQTHELTGVANRRTFMLAASQEIARSPRNRRVLPLAYLDIDGFKVVTSG